MMTSASGRRLAAQVAILGTLLPAHVRSIPQQAGLGVTAFVDVSVIPLDRPRVLERQTVIVEGDRIREMGPAAEVGVPPGAIVVSGEGKYLMPGLMDMHVHLWDEGDLLLYVANGVTTVRSMFGSPTHLEWREAIKRGQRLGPTIYTTGPILDGEPAYWPGSVVLTTREAAIDAVREQKEAGYDGVKVYENLLPGVYESIVAAAERYDLPVYGHVPIRVDLSRALNSGQRSFEHMMDFVYALLPDSSPIRATLNDALAGKVEDKSQALFVAPYENADETRLPEIVAEVVRSEAWICPTLIVAQRAARDSVESAALWRHPHMAYVAPEVRDYWRDQDARLRSERVDVAGMKRGVQLEVRYVAALHRAGAKLLLGTDTPNTFVFPGLSAHEELQNLVDAGFSPYEALRAATADAARFLGISTEVGTIARGMRADLLLLGADPLDDIGATRTVKGVMVRGQWHSESDLVARLADLASGIRERDAGRSPR